MGSPPQAWKVDGRLLPEYYDDYAHRILNYVSYIKANTGVDFTQVCPNNEPGIGKPNDVYHFQIGKTEYPEFLKVAGPILRNGLNPKVKIVAPDDWNISQSIQYANIIMADPEARNYVDVLSTHGYFWGSSNPRHSSTPSLWQDFAGIAQRYSKPVALTETWLGGSNNPKSDPAGVLTAKWIHHAFVDGQAIEFQWWDMIDKGQYSGTRRGFIHSKDWPCKNGICEFRTNGITKWGHAFKQFAHWVRPGAIRVAASSDDSNVLVSSYKHPPDNTFTIVAINDSGDRDKRVTFNINGLNSVSTLAVYRTSLTEDSVDLGPIQVTNHAFTYTLPKESTTTFSGTEAPLEESEGVRP